MVNDGLAGAPTPATAAAAEKERKGQEGYKRALRVLGRSPVARSALAYFLVHQPQKSLGAMAGTILDNTCVVFPVAPAVLAHEQAQPALCTLSQTLVADTLKFLLRSVPRQQRSFCEHLRSLDEAQRVAVQCDQQLAAKMPVPLPKAPPPPPVDPRRPHARRPLQRPPQKGPRETRLEHQLTMLVVVVKKLRECETRLSLLVSSVRSA